MNYYWNFAIVGYFKRNLIGLLNIDSQTKEGNTQAVQCLLTLHNFLRFGRLTPSKLFSIITLVPTNPKMNDFLYQSDEDLLSDLLDYEFPKEELSREEEELLKQF